MAAETPQTPRPLMPLSGWLAVVALLVGVGGALYLAWHEAQTSVLIPVPARDLPAYHQIQSGDLTQQAYASRNLTPATLRESAQIVGRYTIVPTPQRRPLSDDQLGPIVDTHLISGTVPIGIPATLAMVLDGNLEAGDIVDIILVPNMTETQFTPAQSLFEEEVLVLDVRPMLESQTAYDEALGHSFVVVIALSQDHRQELAAKSPGATLMITRKR